MSFLAQTAYAQTFEKVSKSPAAPIISKIVTNIVAPIVYLAFVVAFLVFAWGIFSLVFVKGEDATSRKEAQSHVMWGVIGMVIMLSAYGIIRVIAGTIGVNDPFL